MTEALAKKFGGRPVFAGDVTFLSLGQVETDAVRVSGSMDQGLCGLRRQGGASGHAIDAEAAPDRVARLEVERVVQLALENLTDIRTVLDIGTGSGLSAEAFASRGLQVFGVDANPEMLPEAQKFVPAGTFREAAAEKLPFQAGKFDLAFMGLVLHETDDVLKALKETRRVAAKRVAILEWPDEEQPFGPPREHRLAYEAITALAKKAGFKDVNQVRLVSLVLYRLER